MAERLSIALLNAHSWPESRRSTERVVDELARYLRDQGHTVDVVSGTRGESVYSITRQGRNYRLRTPRSQLGDRLGLRPTETFGLRALLSLVVRRYDVVHAFTPAAAIAAAVTRQRSLFTIGDPAAHSGPVAKRALRSAVSLARGVVALSESAASEVQRDFERKACVLRPGIFVEQYEPNLRPRATTPTVLFSGELANRANGLPLLLEAFEQFLHRNARARLALSGPGRPDWALSQTEDTIEKAVDILGPPPLEDPAEHYRTAHVTVAPSGGGSSGRVVIESLAAGTPVVAMSGNGADELITETGVGAVFSSATAEALASALETCFALAEVPETPKRCRLHAQTWEWSRVGPTYESLYRSIAVADGTPLRLRG